MLEYFMPKMWGGGELAQPHLSNRRNILAHIMEKSGWGDGSWLQAWLNQSHSIVFS